MAEHRTPQTMEEEYNPEGVSRRKWAEFVGTQLAAFFVDSKLQKLSCEDENGNKAKLSRTKDGDVKVESSSVTIM